MTDNIDILMDLDPLHLTSAHVDSLVLYYRRQRANVASGTKPKKESGPKLTLEDLGVVAPKPTLSIRR